MYFKPICLCLFQQHANCSGIRLYGYYIRITFRSLYRSGLVLPKPILEAWLLLIQLYSYVHHSGYTEGFITDVLQPRCDIRIRHDMAASLYGFYMLSIP